MKTNRQRAARFGAANNGARCTCRIGGNGMRRRRLRAASACMGALLAPAVFFSAAADAEPRRGEWFASVAVARFDTSSDYDFGFASGGAVGVGYAATDSLAAEVAYMEWRASRGTGRSRWITALWTPWQAKTGARVRPYLLAGGGNATHAPDSNWSSGRCGQWFAGAGLFGSLGEHVHWRGDLRGVGTNGSRGVAPYVQLGLTVSWGGAKSSVRPPPAETPPPVPAPPPTPTGTVEG